MVIGTRLVRARSARAGRVLRRAVEGLEERRMLSSYFVNMTGETWEDVPGYMTDIGAGYGDRTDRGNPGVNYGWIDSQTKLPVNNVPNGRNRNSATTPANPQTPIPELYDSFNHLQKLATPWWWEIQVPNGFYNVHIASGDPTNTNSRFQMQVEGVQVYDVQGTVSRWAEGTVGVNVTDGRLTVGTGPDANNAKLNFVEITSVDSPPSQAPVLKVQPESSKVVLNWNGIPNTLNYKVYRGTSPGTETLYQSAVTGTTFTDTAVTVGNTYSYYVVPSSPLGTGPQSNEVTYQVTAPYVHVNFQPSTTTKPTPTGYLKDSGEAFGDRGNAFTYGWWNAADGVTPAPTADASTRERNATTDARYDTIVQLHKGGESPAAGPVWWEINIPNGTYQVRVVAGDASNTDEFLSFVAEANKVGGVPQVDGSGVSLVHTNAATTGNFADSGYVPVTVTDGNLTISEGPDQSNNKIAFIDVDTLTVLAPPANPTGLTISNVRASQLTLNWTDNSTNETSFRIEQSSDGVTFTPMGSAPAHTGTGAVSYVVPGLTPSTHYYYRVYAVNLQGDSASATNVADAMTTAVTGGLTGRVVTGFSGDVNLTTEGTADWAHWGSIDANTFEHKANVTSQISDVTPVGASSKVQLTGSPTTFSWTDGKTNQTASGTANELGTFAWGHGFTFTVPADTSARALRVYLGVNNLRGQILARLSDGSAPDYVDSAITAGNANNDGVYTLVYKAASPGQTLSVTWIELPNNGDQIAGRLNLKAATLQVVQIPTGGATSVVATPLNSGRVKLSWTDSATNALGYYIERAPDVNGSPGTFTRVAQTSNPATTFVDSGGGQANTKVYYRLIPYNIAQDPGTPSAPVAVTTVNGTFGDGALATYYDNPDLSGGNDPVLGTPWPTTSIDPTINFDYGTAAPAGAGAGFGADTFMVRWSAKVKPEFTGQYLFGADTDDGMRLWVNGVNLINNLSRRGGLGTITDASQPVTLIAGQTYDIQFDMAENTGGAGARLYWSAKDPTGTVDLLPREIIPQATLFHSNQDSTTAPKVNAVVVDGRLPVTMAPDPHQQIGVQFGENVGPSIDNFDFVIQSLAPGGPTYDGSNFNVFWDGASDTAFIYFTTLPNGLPDGNYRITVKADSVMDNFNNVLDGNNDNVAGGDYVANFFVFAGDANHDRSVDFNDLVVLAQNYNTTGKVFVEGDFNHDGAVDFNDLVILAQRYNTTLPPAPAPAPAPAAATSATVQALEAVAPVTTTTTTTTTATPKSVAKPVFKPVARQPVRPVGPKKPAPVSAPVAKFATKKISATKELLA